MNSNSTRWSSQLVFCLLANARIISSIFRFAISVIPSVGVWYDLDEDSLTPRDLKSVLQNFHINTESLSDIDYFGNPYGW